MKLSTGVIFCFLILGVSSQRWASFLKEAGQGAKDMWRAYSDMREANYKNSDKYFHARVYDILLGNMSLFNAMGMISCF
uniref:Serum amyloid A protein n=1 Tax=Catagonus wagneri TaxID=51154 RepID=A0A8C3WRE4_9CETA